MAASPALADTVDDVTDDCGRLAGSERFGTSAAIASAYDTQSPADTVIVASGRNFPDALAASGLARELNAPIILVEPDSVPLSAASGLEDVAPTNVVIVGGTAAVSQGVEDTLSQDYTVTRTAGDDRYETAEEIAGDITAAGDHNGLTTALIATGNNYPDALAGGPVAYHGDGTNPFPILLTDGAEVPAATERALAALGIEQVIILGGTDAVPTAAETELEALTGNDAIRLAEAAREGTARAVANFAVTEQGFAPDAVLLADGRLRFPSPDALSGGPLGGVVMAPILLVNPGLPAPTEEFITENAAAIQQVIALGGTAAVPTEVLNAACEAGGVPVPGQTPASNQTFTVTPAEEATNEASTATTNDGRRTYTLSGLDDTETYRLELFPSENITVDADGIVTFVDATDDGLADGDGGTTAVIEQVNGLAVVFSDEMDVTSEDGTLTFAVDSTTGESIRPVLWLDAEATGDDELDVDADGAPTEDFGVGGIKNWFVEATAGVQGADATVTNVDTENNFFDAGGERFFYDANDTFQISPDGIAACATVNQATFEGELSTADVVDATTVYGDNDATVGGADDSTFCLNNVNPDETVFVANPVNDTSVQVVITDDDDEQDSFNIYRADEACAGAVFPTDYTLVTTVAATDTDDDGDDEASFTDTGLTAATTYCYAVTAVNGGDEGTGTLGTDEATTTAAGTQAAPTTNNAVLTTDDVVTGAADDTDVWTVTFSEAMADGGTGTEDGTFTITDADGDVAIVDCGLAVAAGDDLTSATCAYDGTDTILTITILETAEDRNVGGNGVLAYPVTITATSGVVDAGDGLAVDLAGSADVVIGEGGTTGD